MNEKKKRDYKFLRNLFFKKKFLKIDFSNICCESINIEYFALLTALSKFNIIDIQYDKYILDKILKVYDISQSRAEEMFMDNFFQPLISISIFFNQNNFENQIKLLKKIVKDKNRYDILNFHFCDLQEQQISPIIDCLKKDNPESMISLSISRMRLSNYSIFNLIDNFFTNVSQELFIEVDNYSINNLNDSSLQRISTADIINKQVRNKFLKYKKIPIIMSIENNSISKLCTQCGVEINGYKIDYSLLKSINKFNYCLSNIKLLEALRLIDEKINYLVIS